MGVEWFEWFEQFEQFEWFEWFESKNLMYFKGM